MRVALVGPYPAEPRSATGGVQSSFVNLLAGLASLGDLELDVLTFVPADGGRDAVQMDGFRVHRLAAPQRFNNLTLYRSSRRALARALDELRPEVVHAQSALGYGYVCLRTAGHAPVVVSVHGIVRETRKLLTGQGDRLAASVAGVALERYCIRRARYLVQPTPYPQEYFGREIAGQIFDVGNAVADSLFALEPTPDPARVLFAGAVVPGKRVHDLVDALARVPGASLRIAGRMREPRYAAALAARIRDLGLEDRVELLGPLPVERMLAEYQRASLLVLPSAQETSPMVIAEAMAAGVPVVATRVGGVRHLVQDGRTGLLVEVGDVEGLAAGIDRLLADERTRSAFAAAARADADRFKATAVAARVRAVYEKAVR